MQVCVHTYFQQRTEQDWWTQLTNNFLPSAGLTNVYVGHITDDCFRFLNNSKHLACSVSTHPTVRLFVKLVIVALKVAVQENTSLFLQRKTQAVFGCPPTNNITRHQKRTTAPVLPVSTKQIYSRVAKLTCEQLVGFQSTSTGQIVPSPACSFSRQQPSLSLDQARG